MSDLILRLIRVVACSFCVSLIHWLGSAQGWEHAAACVVVIFLSESWGISSELASIRKRLEKTTLVFAIDAKRATDQKSEAGP